MSEHAISLSTAHLPRIADETDDAHLLSHETVRSINDTVYNALGAVVGAPALGTALAAWANRDDHVDWDAALRDVNFAALGWLSGTAVALRGANLTWQGLSMVYATGAVGGRAIDAVEKARRTHSVGQTVKCGFDPLAAMNDGSSMVMAHLGGLAISTLGRRVFGSMFRRGDSPPHASAKHPPAPEPLAPPISPEPRRIESFPTTPAPFLQTAHCDALCEPLSLGLEDAVHALRQRISSLQRGVETLDVLARQGVPLKRRLEKARALADAADRTLVDPALESDAFDSGVGRLAQINLQKELDAVTATINRKVAQLNRLGSDVAALPPAAQATRAASKPAGPAQTRQMLAAALRNSDDPAFVSARQAWSNSLLELDSRQELIENVLRAHTRNDRRGQAASVAQLRARLVDMHCQERLPIHTHYVEAMISAIRRLPGEMRNVSPAREAVASLEALQRRFTSVSRELLDADKQLQLASNWQLTGSHAKTSELQREIFSLNTQLVQLDEALSQPTARPKLTIQPRPGSN